MMFKSKLVCFIGAVSLSSSVFALHQKPEVCPNISAIQAEGVTKAVDSQENIYYTFNQSNYNTEVNWVFIIGPIQSNSPKTAINEGNKLLSTVSGNPEPKEEEDGAWVCDYETNSSDLVAFAVLTDENIVPLRSFRKFIG